MMMMMIRPHRVGLCQEEPRRKPTLVHSGNRVAFAVLAFAFQLQTKKKKKKKRQLQLQQREPWLRVTLP